MTSLCYPYGSGITCVCDDSGRIYKCFPDIKGDQSSQKSGAGSLGGVMIGANTQLDSLHRKLGLDPDTFDRSTEIVLASTFLILVILIFVAFIIHRCEKTFVRRRSQDLTGDNFYTRPALNSVSIQTDPPVWSLQSSYTMPMLANGHTTNKTGLTSFYGNGTLPRGRIENHHVATTCSRYELRQQQPGPEVECIKSYDQLLTGNSSREPRDSCDPDTETHRMIDSTSGSGVHQSEAEDVSETDVLVPTFSPSVMEKY